MKKIKYLAAALMLVAACQTPEEILPSTPGKGINNFTVYATWAGYHSADETGFPSVIDYENHTITVQVPYTLPVASDNVQKLEDYPDVWCQFNLDDNVYVEPSLLRIDLSKTYVVNVTDQVKNVSQWTINAALVKSKECDIESFSIEGIDAPVVVDKTNKRLMLMYFDDLDKVKASYTLSPHASIFPDPATVPFSSSISHNVTFTVTAQDGTTFSNWTLIQSVPDKVKEGFREGSEQIIWAQKLSAVNVPVLNMTTGIAASEDYVVLNTRGQDAIVLDAKSGTFVKTLNLGSIQTDNGNYYMTSDDVGHFVICNMIPGDGSQFKVYRLKDVNSEPELLLTAELAGTFGKKISVSGDVYGDAAISACDCTWSSAKTTRNLLFVIRNGALSETIDREIVGTTNKWTNGDTATAGINADDDYFAIGYSSNTLMWVDGVTNEVKGGITHFNGNNQCLSADAVYFNDVLYAASASETSFTYGVCGSMTMFEATSAANWEGSIPIAYGSYELPKAVVYDLPRGSGGYGQYGGYLNDGVNANAYSDVLLHVSKDGYFLYAYFLFCNGYVGCVQFDCIAD